MTKVPTIKLNDDREIPQIGLGLWMVKDKAEFDRAFDAAVETGYRHFDSAQAYDNEQFLGAAWQKSGLKRDEIWLTTKINIANFGHDKTLKSFDESLKKLQTEYVDLLLLHFPMKNKLRDSWKALEEIHAAGKAKSIGVSNYTIDQLRDMKTYAKTMPAVNQVELHVFLQQPELLQYCKENNIAVEAYSPLAHGAVIAFQDNDVMKNIAGKYSKTPAQIMLRWCVEKDLIILPKSVTPSRIRENFDVFDFSLDKDDMAQLAELDKNLRTCWDPTTSPMSDGVKLSLKGATELAKFGAQHVRDIKKVLKK